MTDNMEEPEVSFIMAGIQNGTATLKSSQLLIKLTMSIPCNLAIILLDTYLVEWKNYSPYANKLRIIICRSFTDNCSNLEATACFSVNK